MAESYLIVYHASSDPTHLRDVGDDPCFDDPPSWGVCRPNVRKWKTVDLGSHLFFLAFVHPDQYFVRGWFEVGEKISYVDAYNRFPNRRNVIIRPLRGNQAIAQVAASRKIEWNDRHRKKAYVKSGFNSIPAFLFATVSGNTTFIQNPEDEHQIDNWKCNRIFQCGTKQFCRCISTNSCLKEGLVSQPQFQHYIVANPRRWADLADLRIPWEAVESQFQVAHKLQTPVYQHNALSVSGDRVARILDFLERRKNGA